MAYNKLMEMLIGGHVSCAGGLHNSLGAASRINANVFQTHPSAPQQWRNIPHNPKTAETYLESHQAAGFPEHYFHAIYLLSIATPKEEHREKSIKSLVHYLEVADALNVKGVVFHPGSHLGAGFEEQLPFMGQALQQTLERASPTNTKLLIENNAGAGACVGRSFEEIAAMIDAAGNPSPSALGVCLDTCHAFASGYDIRTVEGVDAMVQKFDETIGLNRLSLIHANDSKGDINSNRDRHANIGEGFIGNDGFKALLHHPALRSMPWVLEVPGIGKGPDMQNVLQLRRLAGLEDRV